MRIRLLATVIVLTFSAGVATAIVRQPSPAAHAATPAPSPSPEAIDLAALVVDPAGYRMVGPATGAVNLPSFLKLAVGDEEVEPALVRLGFRRGYHATWQGTQGGSMLATYLFEFGSVSGARRYAAAIDPVSQRFVKPFRFAVDGLPIDGLADATPGQGFYRQVVVVQFRTVAGLVICLSPGRTPNPDLITLAQRQYAML